LYPSGRPHSRTFMVGGHQSSRVEIIERVRESEEEMSASTDLVILILIIGILIAALAYLYNRNQKTEEALALSLKMQKEALKGEGKKDRVEEAKKVLAMLEHYDKKKAKSRTDEETSGYSEEDKKKRKKRKGKKDMFTYDELFGVDKKKTNEYGKVMLSVTEGGYKIPWIEGSGKIIELGPKLVKAMLEATQRGEPMPKGAPPFPPAYGAMSALKCAATAPDRPTIAKIHHQMAQAAAATDAKKAAK
ncbi:hypothetical protein PFISCL1PPCAC_9061, partial [Pristionchus fissidentatus]